MRSSVRQMTVAILLMILLAPGLLHARTAPARHPAPAKVSAVSLVDVLSDSARSVWNLLTGYVKNGAVLDPNGIPVPPGTSTTNGDNGAILDPNGGTGH